MAKRKAIQDSDEESDSVTPVNAISSSALELDSAGSTNGASSTASNSTATSSRHTPVKTRRTDVSQHQQQQPPKSNHLVERPPATQRQSVAAGSQMAISNNSRFRKKLSMGGYSEMSQLEQTSFDVISRALEFFLNYFLCLAGFVLIRRTNCC